MEEIAVKDLRSIYFWRLRIFECKGISISCVSTQNGGIISIPAVERRANYLARFYNIDIQILHSLDVVLSSVDMFAVMCTVLIEMVHIGGNAIDNCWLQLAPAYRNQVQFRRTPE